MRETFNAIALGIGYLSLAATAVVLVGAVVMNLRPAPKKPAPLEYLPAEVNPHKLKHPTLHVDAASHDEAWAAISRRAS